MQRPSFVPEKRDWVGTNDAYFPNDRDTRLLTPENRLVHASRTAPRTEQTVTDTIEYRAANRSNRWSTTGLVLAVLTLAISLTFFWFYGIPPLIFGLASLYYVRKSRAEGTARRRQTNIAIVLVALAAVITIVLLAQNWNHLY